ncbi:MAG: thiamine phosphate synthase [Burkholderiaceae bacterium]|nr:thiamine phosphate synthase [Burkholderiaceae bacterium]
MQATSRHRSRTRCARHGAQLVVNDHWQAALEQGAGFIHLGQADLDAADVAAITRAGARLGLSTHDRAELNRALALQPAYIALGPIWPTLLKQMPWQPQGLDKLTLWKSRTGGISLVAIGGLTLPRLPAVFAADPEALTRLWLHGDPGAGDGWGEAADDHVPDQVEMYNLHRQTLYSAADIGEPTAVAAAARATALNLDCNSTAIVDRLDPANAPGLLAAVDRVVDAADSFAVT